MRVVIDNTKTIEFNHSVRFEFDLPDNERLNTTITHEGIIHDLVINDEIEATSSETFVEISENM